MGCGESSEAVEAQRRYERKIFTLESEKAALERENERLREQQQMQQGGRVSPTKIDPYSSSSSYGYNASGPRQKLEELQEELAQSKRTISKLQELLRSSKTEEENHHYQNKSNMRFEQALVYVRSLPKDQLSNEEKLIFYGLYKQATEGDVQGSQPWAVQVEARAKWDAWNSRKGMSQEKAEATYVSEMTRITKEKGEEDRASKAPQSQQNDTSSRWKAEKVEYEVTIEELRREVASLRCVTVELYGKQNEVARLRQELALTRQQVQTLEMDPYEKDADERSSRSSTTRTTTPPRVIFGGFGDGFGTTTTRLNGAVPEDEKAGVNEETDTSSCVSSSCSSSDYDSGEEESSCTTTSTEKSFNDDNSRGGRGVDAAASSPNLESHRQQRTPAATSDSSSEGGTDGCGAAAARSHRYQEVSAREPLATTTTASSASSLSSTAPTTSSILDRQGTSTTFSYKNYRGVSDVYSSRYGGGASRATSSFILE